MRTYITTVLVAVGMILSHVPLASAQGSAGDWANVKAVAVDERLIVKQKNGRKIEGRMIEASDGNLAISRDGKVVNVARADIQEIWHSTGKAKKGKWALIGTGIGAGTGAGLGAIKYDPDKDDYGIYPAMGCLIGAGVGALVGVAFGASRRSRTLIYQVQ